MAGAHIHDFSVTSFQAPSGWSSVLVLFAELRRTTILCRHFVPGPVAFFADLHILPCFPALYGTDTKFQHAIGYLRMTYSTRLACIARI